MKHELSKIIFVGSGLLVTRLLSLIIAIFVARVSGNAGFGQFTVFITIFLVVSELSRVLDATFIRFAKSPTEKGNEKKWHSVSIIVKFFYIFTFLSIGFFISPFLANYVFQKPEAANIIRFGFFAGSILSVYTSISAWFQMQSRFILVAICRPIFFLVICFCLLVFYITGVNFSITIIIYLYTIIAGCLSLCAFLMFFKQIKRLFIESFLSLFQFLKIAGILLLSSCIALISNRLDIFCITKYVTFEEIGLYGAAVRLASIVGMLTGAISIVLLPKAASAVCDKRKFKRYLKTSLLYAFIQTLFAFVLILSLNPLINLTVGKDYYSSVNIAIILIFQVLLTSYGEPFKALLQCGNRPQWMVILSGFKLLISLILLMILIRLYGLIGAAYAVTISAGIISFSTMAVAFKENWSRGPQFQVVEKYPTYKDNREE